MTIYLYVKKHNITGLCYLGKTEQNPLTYTGSGTLWKRHLSKHGNDVTTSIIKECDANDEVKQWGKYYSDLWNIVESKEWANLKEEQGEGGAIGLGTKHPNYDSQKRTWIHKTGTVEILTLWEIHNKYNIHKSGLSEIARNVRNGHCKGWYAVPPGIDPHVYLEEQRQRKRNNPNVFKSKNIDK